MVRATFVPWGTLWTNSTRLRPMLVGLKAKAVVNTRQNNKTKEMQNNVRRLVSLDEEESALPG
jgi:hypothetical protein